MNYKRQLPRATRFVVLLSILGTAAGWILGAGRAPSPQVGAASLAAQRKPDGSAQLIAWEPLPAEGQMCEWAPERATLRLAALQQEDAR